MNYFLNIDKLFRVELSRKCFYYFAMLTGLVVKQLMIFKVFK